MQLGPHLKKKKEVNWLWIDELPSSSGLRVLLFRLLYIYHFGRCLLAPFELRVPTTKLPSLRLKPQKCNKFLLFYSNLFFYFSLAKLCVLFQKLAFLFFVQIVNLWCEPFNDASFNESCCLRRRIVFRPENKKQPHNSVEMKRSKGKNKYIRFFPHFIAWMKNTRPVAPKLFYGIL